MASSLSSSYSSSSTLLCFLCFLSLQISSSTNITIPLTKYTTNPSPDPFKYLNQLATTSLNRAKHLKNAQITKAPMFSHSYGGYSISLNFGTPPQTIPFLMDTGSDLVWFPCTHRYQCRNCSFSDSNTPEIPHFIPKLSSSSKFLGCLNPKCEWIHHSDAQSRCRDCEPGSRNCTQICPPYLILYGSGTTGGVMLSETLDLPENPVPNFIVGCSLFSSRQPAGIAGFGRGSPSMPGQLGLKKFSYCLISHHFDDTSKSSSLILDTGSDSGKKTFGVSYTPFTKNPNVAGKRAFSVYYYVGLRKITVGGKRVKIPHKHLSPGSDGNGGTIIDSGTTFTFMTGELFNLVASEFINQVQNYKRDTNVERITGLRPCFNISGLKTVSLPEMKFHFKGGAEMALPLSNYFSIAGESGAACLTTVTDGVAGIEMSGGPSIILGNFQMQNYYVEYDLRNERLGFRQQSCL